MHRRIILPPGSHRAAGKDNNRLAFVASYSPCPLFLVVDSVSVIVFRDYLTVVLQRVTPPIYQCSTE